MSAPTSWSAETVTAELPAVAEPAPAPLSSGYRMPRVDLLPVEVREERRLRAVQRGLVVSVAGVVLLAAGVYVESVLDRSGAASGLAVQQQRAATLTASQQRYAQVPLVQAQVSAARNALAQGLVDDVRWDEYLDRLSRTTPDGVSLTHLSATVAATGTTAAASTTADPLTPTGIGTLTVSAKGADQLDTAAWLDALDAVPGLAGASFSASTLSEASGSSTDTSGTTIASSAVITADALSHRYDAGKD